MSPRLVSLLLSDLITQAGAGYVFKKPDTVCVTYLSTYFVPVSSNAPGSVRTDDANITSQTFDAVAASTTFESGIGPSLDLTETLQLLGLFLMILDASAFSLSDGRLLDDGKPIYYNGEDYKELQGQQTTPPRGAVTTTFAGDGRFLLFRSPDLPNGEAGFFDDCKDGQTSASAAPKSTDLRILQPTANSALTSIPFSTAIASVPDDSAGFTSLVDFTSLILLSMEPTQTRPLHTSSFRFPNTSTNAFPTVPIETSEDLTFTNIPGLTTEDARSSFPEATTPTVPETETTTSELSVRVSRTGTAIGIDTTTDIKTTTVIDTTTDMETISTTTTLESASTSEITAEFQTTTSDAETTTTTSPPARACESYLINPTVLFSGDQDNEDGVKELTLPLPVGLYTDFSDTIYVGVNGLISLFDNSIAQSSNNPFQDNALPSVAIAAYWDDLRIQGNADYEITYRVYDDADYRAVNIDWRVMDADDVVTHFMVILRAYDLSNPESVFMRYFQSNGGKSATIAVQNLDDAKSEQFSYNMENAVPDGCTVLFFTIGGIKELFMCRHKGHLTPYTTHHPLHVIHSCT
ncbi:hypothetical protein BFJ72_g4065 [Fusarium proliferatum]|uniref:DUF7908 domain-containing protein n=1 Tax=Gibberella intermedia TaxID=948311 RepID=A0A420TS69_GIBIN|nr:hypothetical protein BFJ72_g4065 [Fusarium proliferatum]